MQQSSTFSQSGVHLHTAVLGTVVSWQRFSHDSVQVTKINSRYSKRKLELKLKNVELKQWRRSWGCGRIHQQIF